jgi:hypothetical protein
MNLVQVGSRNHRVTSKPCKSAMKSIAEGVAASARGYTKVTSLKRHFGNALLETSFWRLRSQFFTTLYANFAWRARLKVKSTDTRRADLVRAFLIQECPYGDK